MGTGLKGGASHHRTFTENVASLEKQYSITDGYFGEKGQGRSFTRNIISENPSDEARNFFDTASYGGILSLMGNGRGHIAKMKDGTIISYREISSSDGSPVVEINISYSNNKGGIKSQKIHFVKGVIK